MGVTAAYDKFYFEITYLSDPSPIITLPCLSLSSKLKFGQDIKVEFAHLSRPWSTGWVALSFLFRLSSCYGDTWPNLHFFFNICRHKSSILTQYHLIPSNTKLYWPSTTKYHPVPLHSNQYHAERIFCMLDIISPTKCVALKWEIAAAASEAQHQKGWLLLRYHPNDCSPLPPSPPNWLLNG